MLTICMVFDSPGEDKDRQERKSPPHSDRDLMDHGRRGDKRKHPGHGGDSHTASHDLLDLHPASPTDPLHLICHNHHSDVNDNSNSMLNGPDDGCYGDRHKLHDSKNSRRKSDKPRKRKRESDSETEPQLDYPGVGVDASGCIDSLLSGGDMPVLEAVSTTEHQDTALVPQATGTSARTCMSPSAADVRAVRRKSPSPEDLSVRPLTSPSPVSQHQTLPRVLSPITTTTCTPSIDSQPSQQQQQQPQQQPQQQQQQTWATPTSLGPDTVQGEMTTGSGSSVRDLEEVMNKHLPSLPADDQQMRAPGVHSDYNNSTSLQKQRSTIQWIGSQHATTDASATNWLRTLYANRESVIRTANMYPRPQYYRPDMQTSLLTPPGSTTDPYKDTTAYSSTGAPGLAQSKTPPASYGLMPEYAAPISVTMASNMAETYSMTPPSSVSPQDKYPTHTAPFGEQLHMEHSQYRGYTPTDNSLSGMPIKPQAYPLPAHCNSHMSVYDRASAVTSAYPTTAYYGTSTGFPYNNHMASPSSPFRDATKNANVW